MSGTGFLMTKDRVTTLAPGIHTLGAQGNAMAIETASGVVLVDTGPGGAKTASAIQGLRSVTDKPVLAIVFSHGHLGYNFGVDQWLAHAAERGDPRPRLIAHARLPDRYRRYIETAGLQSWLNSRQFRTAYPAEVQPHWYRMPDETYDTRMVIDGGDREVVLIYAPSETDDTTAVWVPDAKVLYGSAAVIKSMPNVGTPLRTIRDPIRWANTLEMLHALGPDILVPEFGAPVTDAQGLADALLLPARLLRWLRAAVVERMNRGMSLDTIVHDIQYPEEFLTHRALKQNYGALDYIVRDIWRSENGWWDRNPTHLHPAEPKAVGHAVFAALGDPAVVLARAKALAEAGEPQLAMHVVDLLVAGPDDNAVVRDATALKASLCETLSAGVSSFVSRNLYLSAADDLRGQAITDADGRKSAWA